MQRRAALLLLPPLLLATMTPARAQSLDLAGARFEPFVQLAGSRLPLNGAGIRYKAIFKVYAAGLYLPAKAGTPEAVYAAAGPRRIHIVMLRDIDANELGKLFTQGMEKNSPREQFSRSINGTLKLADLFSRRKRLAAGETFSVDWLPGTGTVVLINGKPEIEPIREPEFFNSLMSIWLGASPADAGLKDALLGRSAAARPSEP
jgi:Chalcone isomerase-like